MYLVLSMYDQLDIVYSIKKKFVRIWTFDLNTCLTKDIWQKKHFMFGISFEI